MVHTSDVLTMQSVKNETKNKTDPRTYIYRYDIVFSIQLSSALPLPWPSALKLIVGLLGFL